MKIKLSKSQWENIGRKTGWIRTAQPVPVPAPAPAQGQPQQQQNPQQPQQQTAQSIKIVKIAGTTSQLELKYALVYKLNSVPENEDEEGLTKVKIFHLTLIGGKFIKPIQSQLMKVIQNINNYPELKDVPEPVFGKAVKVSRPDGRITVAAPITNQSDFKQYVDTLCKIAGVSNPEPNRFFHCSIANNQGGDPFKSIGDINQNDFSTQLQNDMKVSKRENNMKIKLSKSQWENIGRKTGWMRTADASMEERMDSFFSPKITLKRHSINGHPIPGFWYVDLNEDYPIVKQLIDEAGIPKSIGAKIADKDLDAFEAVAGKHGYSVETIGE